MSQYVERGMPVGDFLDRIIAKRTARNPDFPNLVEEELARLDQEYPPPSDPGLRITAGVTWRSPYVEEHRRNLSEGVRKLAGKAKERADRRKPKTSA